MQNSNKIDYTQCFVAYIDILGFSELVKQSKKNKNLLPVIKRALTTMGKVPSGTKETRHPNAKGELIEKRWHIQTRAFSDHIVIFMPKEAGSITQILFMVRYLHDRMLELGLCVRGAVTIGDMYWDEVWSYPQNSCEPTKYTQRVIYDRSNLKFPITVGLGLITAHELESKYAIYPRVLIDSKLYNYVKKENLYPSPLGTYEHPDRLLTDFIKKDIDRRRFLDLLHPEINRNDTERIVRKDENGRFSIVWDRDTNTHQKVMDSIKQIIDNNLNQKDKKIKAKYEWLETYYLSKII
ncbi:MAG: hypothetical protein A2Y40_10220 [Candidatus Margulisbacteria bacterium GWF2_35_9]|nr:MAG: hypothetical protein A2Y40_10220 [Candidatus Margulisbacteria bacterium GWF2_35_9]